MNLNPNHFIPHIVQRSIPLVANSVLSEVSPLLRRIYLARGIRSTQELNLNLTNLLPPYNLSGITAAVELLGQAIINHDRIAIAGDFDADGATASALCLLVLKSLGAVNVKIFIPDRFIMGYGLTPALVETISSWKAKLILTVDAGISSIAGVTRARELGMQVIITDHHLPGDILPNANAIVNPNLHNEIFAGKNTAGVGVAFYFLAALRRKLQPNFNMAALLDLVALGTVADLVPLDYNNRILVYQGLKLIRAKRCRHGIAALLQVAKCSTERVTTNDLAYQVAPRLNAAGRLETMELGVECLLNDDPKQALEQAQRLDSLNRERRDIEQGMKTQAELMLQEIALTGDIPLGLCLYNSNWHQGVIGILASRIKELYHRPVIALALGDDGIVKGSARSIAAVHIRDVLVDIDRRYPGLLIRYGGHAMAAGLVLQLEKVTTFSNVFAETVHANLKGVLPQTQILTDGVLHPEEITAETAILLRYAMPWGQTFPAPIFDGEFKIRSQRIVGKGHLKLILAYNTDRNLNAIVFRWNKPLLDKDHVRIAYHLELSEFNGKQYPELIVEHLESI
jgi:single-stranded-DNA-specific exonuclease